jgi:hypothetical protein
VSIKVVDGKSTSGEESLGFDFGGLSEDLHTTPTGSNGLVKHRPRVDERAVLHNA